MSETQNEAGRRRAPRWMKLLLVLSLLANAAVIGIAGVRYSIETPEDRDRQFRSLAPVVHFLEGNYAETVSMEAMAELACLSATHFNRQFLATFGRSPTQFIHSLRVENGRQLLAQTDRGIGVIALELGYHDQSHFTRKFKAITGLTPRVYRKRFREK